MSRRTKRPKMPNLDLAPGQVPPPLRDEKGRLLPGQVLNPSGKSSNYFEIIKLARTFSEEAVLKLVHLMRGAEREDIQLAATNALLDRGLGKAPQTVEINVDGPARDLTDQALRIAAQEILARLPEGATIEVEGESKPAQTLEVEILPPSPRDPMSGSD